MRYLIIFAAIASWSFKGEDACLLEVRAVFDQLNTMPSSVREASYVHYTVISTAKSSMSEGKPAVSKADFEMLSSSRQNRVYNKDMILLKDQKNTFVVLPSRKTIYISDAVKGRKDENLYSKLKLLQDTIFRNAERVECRLVENQSYNKVVTLLLNKRMSSYLDIKRVTYYINSHTRILKRVFVEYLENKPQVSLDYLFNHTDFHYKKEDMSVPVKDLVLETDKQPLALYSGFNIIDNRKK